MSSDTRARMIETTARLLQHRGYHGTALSEIVTDRRLRARHAYARQLQAKRAAADLA